MACGWSRVPWPKRSAAGDRRRRRWILAVCVALALAPAVLPLASLPAVPSAQAFSPPPRRRGGGSLLLDARPAEGVPAEVGGADGAALDGTRAADGTRATAYKKRHSRSVCLLPPSPLAGGGGDACASAAWEAVREVRLALRDPGFFRWPPHVNLLYPFVEEADNNDDDGSLLAKLRRAALGVEPFWVSLDLGNLETFGDDTRGVLWADPKSHRGDRPGATQAPIEELQALLEREFPMCSESLKERTFVPHMTMSAKFGSLGDAKAAAACLDARRRGETTRVVSFRCEEFYLLERESDDAQFLKKATIALGRGATGSGVRLHDPPEVIGGMPPSEEGWVRTETEGFRARRRKNQAHRKRGGGRTRPGYRARRRQKLAAKHSGAPARDARRRDPPLRHDTDEEVARKRAERRARREQQQQQRGRASGHTRAARDGRPGAAVCRGVQKKTNQNKTKRDETRRRVGEEDRGKLPFGAGAFPATFRARRAPIEHEPKRSIKTKPRRDGKDGHTIAVYSHENTECSGTVSIGCKAPGRNVRTLRFGAMKK
ncbi:unnamed protein product [Pseudo-nitzschia multistriata]|uniref:Uncharacterized protein n=1 Tax=Pseudo-nitzschia multistriata TaxID=183589 RepID=A0A448Z0U1_9STRA|nr:unnamed protein product [Pseudo-nitzschia multistriata]